MANPLAKRMLEEHAMIRSLTDELRRIVASPPRSAKPDWLGNFHTRFDELATLMRSHMAMEEEGGYLTQVLAKRPTLSPIVDMLRHEHDEFRTLIDTLQNTIGALSPEGRLLIWDCCKRVENLIGWQERHEEHENHLIMYVFTQDEGTSG